MPMQYQFCRVCRHNHNQGKGHRLSTKHKLRVDALLKKFQKNIQEVKFFLKNAMRLRGDFGNRSKFWCNFCEQETSEDKSEFACAETIRHLASKTHVEAVKRFWFENGGDVGKRSLFHFSEIDLEKWEEACRMAPLQDGHDSLGNQMNRIKVFSILAFQMARFSLKLPHLLSLGLSTTSRNLVPIMEHSKTARV
ncbi:hypothetical protein MPTK1_1g09560 [Marchantia polymorpha subsp. ruderalis]|uniref:Uncharacterized protein n=2 Tax=Marchantia polymorpha TaxID=3197 RepID=A0AAF6ANB2_MARPO|nr:hypothetical protein MARPO_0096s0044 [Marchantia polymorpha]BBM97932.1 hypothetical protein Mp_1g09560 [Marchantia polymorpha subsp. ruderalis]|eukprot:PTQ32697.1 hypothetical protein MARPO_0096s0044 [Marchantia polymorpha]